mgnify:CR=1 FL=1
MVWSFIKSIFKGKEEKSEPKVLTEAPASHRSLEEMTKEELDALGEQHGLNLDRRRRKATLIQQLKDNNILHG